MSRHNKSHRRRGPAARFTPPTEKEQEALKKVRYREPRRGCAKCYGRGFIGRDSMTMELRPCSCVFQHPPQPLKPKLRRHSVRDRLRAALVSGQQPSQHDNRWLTRAGIDIKNRLARWLQCVLLAARKHEKATI